MSCVNFRCVVVHIFSNSSSFGYDLDRISSFLIIFFSLNLIFISQLFKVLNLLAKEKLSEHNLFRWSVSYKEVYINSLIQRDSYKDPMIQIYISVIETIRKNVRTSGCTNIWIYLSIYLYTDDLKPQVSRRLFHDIFLI